MKKFFEELKSKYYKEDDIDRYNMVCKIENYIEELENKNIYYEKSRDNFKRFLNNQIDEIAKKFDKKDPIMKEKMKSYCDILKDYNVFMK